MSWDNADSVSIRNAGLSAGKNLLSLRAIDDLSLDIFDKLLLGMDVKLYVNALDMRPRGILSDAEISGNGVCAPASGKLHENLRLARGKAMLDCPLLHASAHAAAHLLLLLEILLGGNSHHRVLRLRSPISGDRLAARPRRNDRGRTLVATAQQDSRHHCK